MNAVIAAMANKLLLYKKKYVSSSPSPKRREPPVGKTIIRYIYNTFITYYTPRDDPVETISTTRASVYCANIRFVKRILRYERVSASEKLQLSFTCEARE